MVDPPIFIGVVAWWSAKSGLVGHRRGRHPRTSAEHSWQTVMQSLYDGRRRCRPPRSGAETILLPWSHQPKEHRRGRPTKNYLRSCLRPSLSFCTLRVGHYLRSDSCYLHIKEDA